MAKFTAEAAILPARFVKAGTVEHQMLQADVDSVPLGVSDQAQKDVRSDVGNANAADAGDSITVHDGHGTQQDRVYVLELGGTVSFGDRLMPDADGKGIKATSGKWFGATADSDGVSGDFIGVQPLIAQLEQT